MKQADLQTNTVVEWITKEEAAKLLDKSVRTVLAMAAAGKIQSKLERDPERGGQKVTLFHAGEVAALAHNDNAGVQARKVTAARLQESSLGLGVQTNQALCGLLIMRAQDPRGVLGSQHVTEHYRIVEFTKPTEDNPHFKFLIDCRPRSGG